jgi:hypothetical protein
MTTQQTVITAIKKVLDKGDIECPGFPLHYFLEKKYGKFAEPYHL